MSYLGCLAREGLECLYLNVVLELREVREFVDIERFGNWIAVEMVGPGTV